MEKPPERPTLPALTSLRFFAAFVVVAFHFDPSRFANLPDFFRRWLETGYEAVTFFFVLSGFIMSYMYSDYGVARPRPLGGRRFFVARFARLAPAYYLAILIALPFIVLDSFVWDPRPVPRFILDALLVNTFLQAWWPPAALAWNPPGWSLSVEWALYAFFPLLGELSRRWSGRTMLIVSFVVLAIVAMIRLLVLGPLVAEDPDNWHAFAYYFPLFHVPTFFFGMALGRIQLTGPRPPPQVAFWMCNISVTLLMLKFSGLFEVPRFLGTDIVHGLIFGVLILGAAQPGHPAVRALSWAPLIWLGEVSYSVYILHEPVALWWDSLVEIRGENFLPLPLQFPVYFAIVLAVSAACFHWVEAPLRRHIRRWLGG